MAKTIEEIIEVNTLGRSGENDPVDIYEIFCGFNQPKEKLVFSGLVKDIPENLLNIRFTGALFDPQTKHHKIEYTDHKSFEGKQLFRPLFLQQQGPI